MEKHHCPTQAKFKIYNEKIGDQQSKKEEESSLKKQETHKNAFQKSGLPMAELWLLGARQNTAERREAQTTEGVNMQDV